MSEVVLFEGTAPASPPAGAYTIYFKVDGKPYYKNSAGTEVGFLPTGAGTGDLMSDGTVPLTADWNMGDFEVTMGTLSLLEPTLAPMTIISTARIPNLNADLLDGWEGAEFVRHIQIDTLAELNGIVTDATLVDEADIVKVADTTLVGTGFFLDEDNMASDDATKVASQQSIKAYVDLKAAGANIYQGEYNASTNTPDLTTSPNSILKGQYWVVGTAGTFFTANLEVGDTLIAEQDDPSLESHWTILQTNLDAASIKTLYESNANTNEFSDQEKTDLGNALLDGDFAAEGLMRTTDGAGSYITIKTNLTATTDPTVDDDSIDGYSELSPWINTTTNVMFICIDPTAAAAVWQELGSGGGLSPVFVTGNYTAAAGEWVLVDTSSIAITVTLPLNPEDKAQVKVTDWANNAAIKNITVARNGETIVGDAEDFTIDQNMGGAEFAYDGTGTDWKHELNGSPTLVNVNDFATGFSATNAQTGTTYTFTEADLVQCVIANNAAASTYDIPDSLAVDGETLSLLNIGAGAVTITVAGSDTLSSSDNKCPQGDAITVLNIGGNDWRVIGGSP